MVSGKLTLLGFLQEDNDLLKDNFINNLPEGIIDSDFGINDFQRMCVMKTLDMEVLISNINTFAELLNSWSKMNKVSWENELNKLLEINKMEMDNVVNETESGNRNKESTGNENNGMTENKENTKSTTENRNNNKSVNTTNESETHSDVQRTTGGDDVTENEVSAFNTTGYVPKDKSTITYGGTEGTIGDSVDSSTNSTEENGTLNSKIDGTESVKTTSEGTKNHSEREKENNTVNKNRNSRNANDILEYSKYVIELNSKFNIIDKIIEEFKLNFFICIY